MNTAKAIINCICGCDQLSNADIDRFTERIENVLGSSQGRGVFKRFMTEKGFTEGTKYLVFYEYLNDTIPRDREVIMNRMDEIMEQADNIDELDFAMMEKLTISLEEDRWDDVATMLKLLKQNTVKLLDPNYIIFRNYLISKVK